MKQLRDNVCRLFGGLAVLSILVFFGASPVWASCSIKTRPDIQSLMEKVDALPPLEEDTASTDRVYQEVLCLVQAGLWSKDLISHEDVNGQLNAQTKVSVARLLDCTQNHTESEITSAKLNSEISIILSELDSLTESCRAAVAKARITRPLPAEPIVTVAENRVQPVNGCLDIGGINDRDIARNRKTLLGNQSICVTRENFTEHGLKWSFLIFTNLRKKNGPVWGILHDNEQAAFDSGLYAITRYGGKMVAVETGEKRVFWGKQDPNRNFGTSRSQTASCQSMYRKPSPEFTSRFMAHFSERYPVLTLHNNANGFSGGGGSGGISARRTSKVMKGLMSPNAKGGLGDEDNAILFAGRSAISKSNGAKKARDYFHKRGVHVIYEHIQNDRSDCSLSNYVVLNKKGRYFNIEAEHGHLKTQRRIVDVLMAYIGVSEI
ncbi:MAG: hypothetical protein NXI17_23365 [Alphaproteobacteria bacterium]|nr:hypothetical protein [Alphaproteobacteria bacterium]